MKNQLIKPKEKAIKIEYNDLYSFIYNYLVSFIEATAHSVVINIDAMLDAFNNALLVTFVGSTMPDFNILTQVPFLASKPIPDLATSAFSQEIEGFSHTESVFYRR